MKTMTCRELGGTCDQVFEAETFEKMAELSKQHGMIMFQQGDQAHIDAMQAMRELAKQPGSVQKWMDEKRALFNAR